MNPSEVPAVELVTVAAQAAPTGQAPGLLGSLPMFIAILAIFYFLLIRPQQKEAKQHQELLASLKKGDRVVTASGIHGRIHEVRDHTVVIEVADKVRLTVDKSAVKRKPDAESAETATSSKGGK